MTCRERGDADHGMRPTEALGERAVNADGGPAAGALRRVGDVRLLPLGSRGTARRGARRRRPREASLRRAARSLDSCSRHRLALPQMRSVAAARLLPVLLRGRRLVLSRLGVCVFSCAFYYLAEEQPRRKRRWAAPTSGGQRRGASRGAQAWRLAQIVVLEDDDTVVCRRARCS